MLASVIDGNVPASALTWTEFDLDAIVRSLVSR